MYLSYQITMTSSVEVNQHFGFMFGWLLVFNCIFYFNTICFILFFSHMGMSIPQLWQAQCINQRHKRLWNWGKTTSIGAET